MGERHLLPAFNLSEGLATFLADLRSWVFSSKLQAAHHFGLAHTTVVRYESGQLRAPAGYLSALARLANERFERDDPFNTTGRDYLLQETNKAIRVCYPGEQPLRDWEMLCRVAEVYTLAHQAAPAEQVAPSAPRLAAPPSPQRQRHWSDAPDVSGFCGREEELRLLTQWALADRCRLIGLIGMGGIGKTTLAARLATLIEQDFEYLIWCSLLNAPPLEDLLEECLLAFPEQSEYELPERLDKRIGLLLSYLQRYRCLLVFDNFEGILGGGDLSGQYQSGYEDYGALLRRAGEILHQSCLILTSRERPREFALLQSASSTTRALQLGGLGLAEIRAMLQDKQLSGPDETWLDLRDRYTGNPLALKLVSETIKEVFDGDLARFLSQNTVVFGGLREVLSQHFARLSELEQAIMYWLAIEHEAVSADQLRRQLLALGAERHLLEALESLRRRSLIEKKETGFTLQNVIIEYMLDQLIEQGYDELTSGSIKRLASHALIKASAKDYIREAQVRLVLKPLLDRLLASFHPQGLQTHLQAIVAQLRGSPLASRSYAGGNILNLLLQLGCDLDGFDFSGTAVWGAYLKGVELHNVNFSAADLSRSVFTETFGGVLSVAVSPEGSLLAAGMASGEVRVWSADDHRQLLSFKQHSDWVRTVAFSPDGRRLASASDDQTIRLWDLETGRCLGILSGHSGRVLAVAFSPDGQLLASGGEDQSVRLWDSRSGAEQRALQGHAGWVCSLVFTSDSRRLVSASQDQTLRLWDVTSGECLRVFEGHSDWVWSVLISPDDQRLISGGMDRTLRCWELESGACRSITHDHADGILTIAATPDWSLLASAGSDQGIRLWDLASGACLRVLQGHRKWVRALAVAPDGRTLISASTDETIRLWDVQSGRCQQTLQGYTSPICAIALSSDGAQLASGGNQLVRLWDIEQARALRSIHERLNDRVWSVAFSPDDQLLAGVSNEEILIWEAASGQLVQQLQGHTGWVRSVAFSPDGQLLASASEDQTVGIWDVRSGACLRRLEGHAAWVWSVAFSPDGQLLASGCDDHTIRLWDAQSGECRAILQGHTNSVWSVAFSPDGQLLASGCDDQTLRLWDVRSDDCRAVLEGHAGQVWSVAFHPGGRLVASGSADRSVRLWDVQSGRCHAVLAGHTDRVRSIAFSPFGTLLASCGDDSVIKLWNPLSGKELRTLRTRRLYEGVDISGVSGLTEAQKAALKELGAIEA